MRESHDGLHSMLGLFDAASMQVVALVSPQFAVALVIRPLPPHFLQGAGKILRPGSAGCLTLGNPVPSQASHFVSRGNLVFMQSFLNKIRRRPRALFYWEKNPNFP